MRPVGHVDLLAILDTARCNDIRSARRRMLAKARVSRARISVIVCKPRDARDDDREALGEPHHIWTLKRWRIRGSSSITCRSRTHRDGFIQRERASSKKPHSGTDNV